MGAVINVRPKNGVTVEKRMRTPVLNIPRNGVDLI
jgi:hypothetical protein